jgi:hypothetical protein
MPKFKSDLKEIGQTTIDDNLVKKWLSFVACYFA